MGPEMARHGRNGPASTPHRIRAGCTLVRSLLAASGATVVLAASSGAAHVTAASRAGTCDSTVTVRLGASEAAVGSEVVVAVDLSPRCAADPLPRHYMLALAAWSDAGATEAVRDMARAFVAGLGPANKVGATLGDGPVPRTVAVGSATGTVDAWLRGFQPTVAGANLADLVRAAHNAYGDATDPSTGLSKLPAGQRHIIVLGNRDMALGRPSQLDFDLVADRDNAIAVDLLCIGGGCPVVDGLRTSEVAGPAEAGAILAALQARPAPSELAWLRLRSWMGSGVEYVFGSAAPPADQLGRSGSGAFAEWRRSSISAPAGFSYRVRPLYSGTVVAASSVDVVGVTTAGVPVRAQTTGSASLEARPRPELPSACRLRGEMMAGPDPVDLGASAAVSLTLQADCPTADRDLDVVLAIDRSSSMLAGERLAHVKTAARAFVEHVDLGRARVAVLAFGTRIEELADLGNDRPTLLAAINDITAEGDTAMAAGLRRAREILGARRPRALPVIVLLSDGVVHDEPQPEADWALVEGIRVVGVWVTMGEQDLVAVFDAPDDETVATFMLTVVGKGTATSKTMRALSEEEFAQVVSRLP